MDITLADHEKDAVEKRQEKLDKKEEKQRVSNKHKYRKDKPWDDGTVDKWKIDQFTKDDNPFPVLEESSFATLFPAYQEQYLKKVWPEVKELLQQHGVKGELDLVEGSMTVKTTKKMFDPYIIIKSRDMIKLLARSVPFPQAQKILEDGVHHEVIKIKSYIRNKEKFVKRRQRLVGPNGSTLKAIELLTDCFLLVQGQTVSVMGPVKGVKQCRSIIVDCMKNIHPVYAIKELMIKKELEKDEKLKDEDWSRFLPKFNTRNEQRKKLKKAKNKKKKGQDANFIPEQQPRKEDIQMETGEYFLKEEEREQKRKEEKMEEMKVKTEEKKKKREREFEAVSGKDDLSSVAKRMKKLAKSSNEDEEANKSTATIAEEKRLEKVDEKRKLLKGKKLKALEKFEKRRVNVNDGEEIRKAQERRENEGKAEKDVGKLKDKLKEKLKKKGVKKDGAKEKVLE